MKPPEEQYATHPDTELERKEVWGRRRDGFSSKESSPNSLSVHPGPASLGYWKEGAMLVRGDAVRISTQCEHVCQPDVNVGFDAAGDFRNHYNGGVLDWSLKINRTNNETTRVGKSGVPTRRRKSKKPSTERVIHTNVFNRSKRNLVRSRVVTRNNTAGVSAPEHTVSPRACRMMSKGRTHQLVSDDVSAVSFSAWLERCAGKASEGFEFERRLASVCDESIPAPDS